MICAKCNTFFFFLLNPLRILALLFHYYSYLHFALYVHTFHRSNLGIIKIPSSLTAIYLNLDHALFNCLSYEIGCYPQVLDFLDLFGAGVSALPVLSVFRFFPFFPSGSVSIAGDGFIVGVHNGVSSTVFPRFLFAFGVTVG
jgi:hypothetical protein